MAGNSQFNTVFSVDFESFDKVKKKLDALTGKLNKGNEIKLDVNTEMITKTINDLSKLTRQNIQILPNGQVKAISTFNSELGKTVKLTQNLSNGKSGISIDNNISKNAQLKRKENEAMYKAMFDSIAQEEKLANQIGASREKSEIRRRQEIQKTEQLQAQASNKAIEQQKREEKSAKELIAIEKQKLDLKLKSIQLNRGSLVDGQSAKNVQAGINGLSGSTVDDVRKRTQALNLELQRLDTNARMKGLMVGNKNVMSLGDSIKATVSKLGIFASSAMVFSQVARMISEGVRYVKYLDSAFTDLSITMDVTQSQFGNMTNDIEKMGKELGTSAKNVMDIAKVYANASTDINTVMSKINPAVMFSNISGMQGEEVTKTLQTVNQQFKLTEKEGYSSAESIEHIGNVMTSVSQNMEYDFKAGLVGLNDAIRTSGSVAYESGMSLEQYTSYIGALMQSTGKSGDELGTFWKMLTARMTQIKGLGEEVGVTSEDMGKAEKALNKFNIEVRRSDGSIRDMDSMLKDISGQWETLTDQERSYVAENVAGNRHRASFLSLMSSITEQQKLYGEAISSTNSLQEANNKYVDSWQGKMGSLTASFQSMMSTLLNGNLFKGGIDIITSVVSGIDSIANSIGTLPTIITAVVGALTIFNAKFRENFNLMTAGIPVVGKWMGSLGNIKANLQSTSMAQQDQIAKMKMMIASYQQAGLSTKTMSSSLVSLQAGLAMTTIKTIATTVAMTAMQAVMSMGLSLAITGIISGITKLCDSLIMTKEELKEFNAELTTSVKESSGNIANVNNLLKEVTDLEKELSSASDKDTRSQLESEILDKRKQIAEIYPMAVSYIDEEGNMIAGNNDLIREQLELEREKASLKALEFMENNKNLASEIQGLAEKKRMYNEMKIAYTRGEKYKKEIETLDPHSGDTYKREVEVKVKKDDLDKLTQEMDDTMTKMSQLKIMYASLSEEDKTGIKGQELTEAMQAWDDYTRSLDNNSNAANNNRTSSDNAADGLDRIGDAADNASDSMKNLTDKFSNTNNTIDLLKGALDEFQSNGFLTAGTFEKFFATGNNELIAMLGNMDTFEANINAKLKEQEAHRTKLRDDIIQQAMASEQASSAEVSNQVNSENVKTQATMDGTNNRKNAVIDEVGSNAQAYDNDVVNKTNSENAKGGVVAGGSNQRSNMVGQEVNNNASAYGADVTNQANSEGSKVVNTSNAIDNITGMITGGLSSLGNAYETDASNYAGSLTSKLASTQSFVNQTNSMLSNIQAVRFPGLNGKPGESVADTMLRGMNGLNGNSNEKVGPINDGYNPVSMKNIKSNFKPVSIGTPSTGRSGGGSGKKGSSGSKSKGSGSSAANKVDIKDTEVKIDRYKQLQDAIDDVNNSLDKNKILQEQANGRNKIKYMNEEISLLKKKKEELKATEKEMQKEARELENQLRKQGLNAKNGDITNYVSKLETQKKKVNAMANSNKSKETEIKKLEELIKTADRYFDLTSNELPKIQNQWLEINSAIKEQRKEYVSLIRSSEEEVFNMLKDKIDKRKEQYEKETDKLREEISRRKDLYNKELNNEDYQKNLKNKQDELSKLELQIEEAARNTSKQGQLALEELLKQKQELQNELNQMIKDQQREEANELFDKEMDDLDKDLENKLEALDKEFSNEKIAQMVKTLISTGFVEIEGEVVKLQQAMKDFYVSQGEVFSDSALKMQEFIDQLETVKNLYGELSAIHADLGVKNGLNVSSYAANSRMAVPNLNLPSLPGVQSRSVEGISMPISLTIEGNVADDTLPKVEKMLADTEKKIYKTINKKFS